MLCVDETHVMPAEPETISIEPIEVERLLLDPKNPRLAHVDVSKGPEGLAKAMWREMAVSEVALSIAENGFFSGGTLSPKAESLVRTAHPVD